MNEIIIEGADFPQKLSINKKISKLHCRGDTSLLYKPAVAVVGTRKPKETTEIVVNELVRHLVEQGFVIVSGLALGVDTWAHQATLENRGKTIAVLPTGLGRITPKQNIQLAENIVEKKGLLVSEYENDTSVKRYMYIQRNRIQVALSQAVIVVESGVKGGTMHTANFAKEFDRILAVIDNVEAAGNRKLREEGAIRLITGRTHDTHTFDLDTFTEFLNDSGNRYSTTT